VVCTGPGNFNGIRASISAMKGICCSLPIELIGINKFQALSKIYKSALISLKYRGNKIYWCILKDEKSIFMSSSEIKDIQSSDDYSDLVVVGYRAEEIATSIKVKKFIEQNEISMQDLLQFSRKVVKPDKFLPKPLYISPSQSLFAKYKGPKILDKPLDVS
jgi:tRNA A37 threonylcarbamoyladenosine modification protein TsaB